ncbi:50S ribosomal protein L13 [candidate division WOR-3 bacterium]|nr:50S ribosomal protein L13 [candidate division WOR-3 bacterium]
MEKWWLVDANGRTLGRLATHIAKMLMGKDKSTYVPWRDDGDTVVCVNAEKVAVTGGKEEKKFYKRYSGYPSGLKFIRFDRMMEEHPERIIYHAVRGMLPKNRLRARRLNKLKIYRGSEHPHQAQAPTKLEI